MLRLDLILDAIRQLIYPIRGVIHESIPSVALPTLIGSAFVLAEWIHASASRLQIRVFPPGAEGSRRPSLHGVILQ